MNVSKETIIEGAKKVKPGDAKKVLGNKRKITKRASKGLLKNLLDDINQMIRMVGDYFSGLYPFVPWWSMSAILFCLLWILNPLDLCPDAIPLLGLIDDLMVTSLCLAMCEQDLREYARWKREQEKEDKSKK